MSKGALTDERREDMNGKWRREGEKGTKEEREEDDEVGKKKKEYIGAAFQEVKKTSRKLRKI